MLEGRGFESLYLRTVEVTVLKTIIMARRKTHKAIRDAQTSTGEDFSEGNQIGKSKYDSLPSEDQALFAEMAAEEDAEDDEDDNDANML